MKIYLDNCCFNRPYDDQSQIRIRLESECILHIQDWISKNRLQLAWSYVPDFENDANPFAERKISIEKWKENAVTDVVQHPGIIENADRLAGFGIKSKDSLHIACAIHAECDYCFNNG